MLDWDLEIPPAQPACNFKLRILIGTDRVEDVFGIAPLGDVAFARCVKPADDLAIEPTTGHEQKQPSIGASRVERQWLSGGNHLGNGRRIAWHSKKSGQQVF